ncbi:MAG: lantibiotic dehydratase family protein [Actinomycetota bacterium]|nr:lantibiotic dehydratase family protein [Actinomycetota bacterium]
MTRLSRGICDVAAEPRFREAIAWQNLGVVSNCLDKVTIEGPRNFKQRHRELIVASYLQRYSMKNDTIGFFGPVGWGHCTSAERAFDVLVGDEPLIRRTTYFESWTIDEVARTLVRLPGMLLWLAPRRTPANVLVGRTVHRPCQEPLTLSDAEARLLTLCDGNRLVTDLATALIEASGDEFRSEQDVLDMLAHLQSLGLVQVDFEGPVETWPEVTLRHKLERIADPQLRARALPLLDELITARDGVAAAAGDPEKVIAAYKRLNTVFHRITGSADVRRPGDTHAGRTLLYEDTVSGVRVRLGRPLIDALSVPLSMILDSGAWLVSQVTDVYRRLFLQLYDQERARAGQSAVPLARLVNAATPYLATAQWGVIPSPVAGVMAEFQQRWARVLDLPTGIRRYSVSAEALADRFKSEFTERKVQWAAAVHHSPDIMIAATDPGAVERGDFLFVLGEIHLGCNTLDSRFLVEQHEDPTQLLRAAEADYGCRRIYAIEPKEEPIVHTRSSPPSSLLPSQYIYWSRSSVMDAAQVPAPVVPVADLLVYRAANQLIVRSQTTKRTFDFIEVISEFLSRAVADAFKPLSAASHRPRVVIDRMVLARESWTFQTSDIAWPFIKDQKKRYLEARMWRARHGLPERMFLRLPAEVECKPFFIDFSSLALANLFAKNVRRAAELSAASVTLTEALPDLGQLWLSDSRGDRYAAELRFVAVDGSAAAKFPFPEERGPQ